MNFTEVLVVFSEESIKVGKSEAGTSASNQEYGKFQDNQDKDQTRNILKLVQRKVHGRITQ